MEAVSAELEGVFDKKKTHHVENRGGKLVVKDKSPAPLQITAEQLLREASLLQSDEVRPPKHRLVDEEEISEYRLRKRKEFEDVLRRKRRNLSVWIQYGMWEAEQKEFRNARSVFERALLVDYENTQVWAKYIEMETKNKFVNSARNLYDRVTTLLPRVDRFWFNYAHFEELLGNYAGARLIYNRWMDWNPGVNCWMLFVRFEERCGELELAREVFCKMLGQRPCTTCFLKYAQFEEDQSDLDRARASYEKAIEVLPQNELDENFFIKFAEFEERHNEFERSKLVYESGLKIIGLKFAPSLYSHFVSFQKRHSDRHSLEKTIRDKRRIFYNNILAENEYDYDVWTDYIRLEKTMGTVEDVEKVFERAVAHPPPTGTTDPHIWERYLFLWYGYAVFHELDNSDDGDKARDIYRRALECVPHNTVKCPRIWILAAQYEVRKLNLDGARKIYGKAISCCPVEEIFKSYCRLELRLKEIGRCRKICAKYIELKPQCPAAWLSLIDLELAVDEYQRAIALFEIAIKREDMDQPELIWKAYIDTQTNLQHFDEAQDLFYRLIDMTHHWKVYRGLAEFEFDVRHSIVAARKALELGVEACKERGLDEERALLLETWFRMEKKNGDQEYIDKVMKMQPTKVRKRRIVKAQDGSGDQWTEEYTAYIYNDGDRNAQKLAIIEAAKKWKMRKLQTNNKTDCKNEQ